MTDRIKALIGGSDGWLLNEIRAVSDRIEVVSPDDAREHPELIGEVEIAYGGLGRAQISQASRLRWIQTTGAGVNGFITPAVRESDLIITNTSGIHAGPITEHMFGMLLMRSRRLAEAWDQQKSRKWRGYEFGPNLGMLAGKTAGILGVGAFGAQSARVGKAFGMRVIGVRRSGEPHPDVERMYRSTERSEWLEFFRESDVVMNLLPLTEQTRLCVSWDEFAAMKPDAVLINAGRGATVDTEAMLSALREGRLGAAMLDVTDPEPLPEDHPLWTMENVYITPHYGGSHPGYQERAGQIFLTNLRRYLAGEPMMNVIDKREGY